MIVSSKLHIPLPSKRWWLLALRHADVYDRIVDLKTRIIEGGGTQNDLNCSGQLLRLEEKQMRILKAMAADRKLQLLKHKKS